MSVLFGMGHIYEIFLFGQVSKCDVVKGDFSIYSLENVRILYSCMMGLGMLRLHLLSFAFFSQVLPWYCREDVLPQHELPRIRY